MLVKRLSVLIAWLAVAAPVRAAEPIDPRNPRQGLFSDEWGEVYMAGGKVGYIHSTMKRHGNMIETRTFTKLVIGRADQPVTISTTAETRETLEGVPVSFSQEMDAAMMKTAVRGAVIGGKVNIVQSQYGMEQTQTFDFPRGAMMAWGLFRESLLKGFEPGTQFTSKVYAPELRLDDAISAVTKVGDLEVIDHAGKPLQSRRVDLTMQSPMGNIDVVSWVDAHGHPVKSIVPMPGLGDIIMVMTDQATALADFVAPELFMTTVIKANRAFKRGAVRSITYRIRSRHPDVNLSEIPATDMQTPRKSADGAVELVVTMQDHAAAPRATLARADAAPGEELAEFLEANLMINTADPKLVELAEKAADKTDNLYALGDKLRRFVTDYVTTKSLGVGFATASETCRTREGDCSEHGVLLAALGRLHGLPSRVAVGLAYVPMFGGEKDVFGYHLWTQFYIDGRWVDFDAALRESRCSPTRIAFATSSLKNTGLADLSLPLLSKIGAIDIDILEVDESP